MADGRSSRRPPWTVIVAIGLMAVHSIGLLVLQLLSNSSCGSHNNDCDGMGLVGDVITGDTGIGVVVNGLIVFGLAYGDRWARSCGVAYYGFVAAAGFPPWILEWKDEAAAVPSGLFVLVWPASVVVLLLCGPTRRWASPAPDGPRDGSSRSTP